jgi:hypothetical protein
VRNRKELLPLPIQEILAWVDAHKSATGDWPNQKSGHVSGTDETWLGIDASLRGGRRGLPSDSSLAALLAEHRRVRNHMDLPDLTIEQVLEWADEYKMATGDWPNQKSEQVRGTDETWAGINTALQRRRRGLPSGSSLARLLGEHRGTCMT